MQTVEVLLVEDNAGDIVLTRQVLADSPTAVRLHIARDGEQALTMLSDPDFKPNLIILDLNLPRIPGNFVLKRYRDTDVPVVVFSSCGNDAEIENVLSLGAREFVQKPTDLQSFVDAVNGIIERWGGEQNSTITCNGG